MNLDYSTCIVDLPFLLLIYTSDVRTMQESTACLLCYRWDCSVKKMSREELDSYLFLEMMAQGEHRRCSWKHGSVVL